MKCIKALVTALAISAAFPALAQRIEHRGEVGRSSATAPTAADQSLGMAMMSAVVAADGSLIRGVRAVSSVKLATGRYDVTFGRSIVDCAGSISIATDGNAIAHAYALAFYAVEPSVFRVITFGQTSNSAADSPFHVLLFCGK